MSRKHRNRQGARPGPRPPHGFTTAAEVSKVLTREGEDVPLDPNLTIDLAMEGRNGTPRFTVRDADPMRPFINSTASVASWPMPGPDGKVSIPISDDLRRRIDKLKAAGETDEDVINRILDETRCPTYPVGTPEYFLGVEMASAIMGQNLEGRQAARLLKSLKQVPPPARFEFLKRHLLDTLGHNDGTAEYGGRVGALMAFVRHTLTPEEGERLTREVLAERQGAPNFTVKVQGPGIGVMLEKDVDPTVVSKIMSAMDPMNPGQRARVLDGLNNRFPGMIPDRVPLDEIPASARQASKKIVEELRAMAADPKLQRLGESCFHKCLEAWTASQLIVPNRTNLPPMLLQETGESWFDGAQVFVVQHNWAAAFKNSAEFAEGAWSLPYPRTAFEFRISGRRCILTMLVGDGYDAEKNQDLRPARSIMTVETTEGWVLSGFFKFSEDGKPTNALVNMPAEFSTMAPVCELAHQQARAICITLEAQVAVTEIVRAPHKLNQKRERQGKLPIYDYHVVDLAHRKRYAARLPEPGDQEVEHGKKRLHWVRAHTRHYPNHKVQIKWHLRGDPDLGFVDKEYRL